MARQVIRLLTVGLMMVVLLMAVARVGTLESWSAFALAVAGAIVGMFGLMTLALIAAVMGRRSGGLTAEKVAQRLAGSGMYDFTVRWQDQPPAYREQQVARAADLMDEMGL